MYQTVPVTPGTDVHLRFLGNASANLPADEGRFGVRVGTLDLASQTFGASTGYVHHEVPVKVPAGLHEVTVYAGFNAPGVDT